MAELCETRLKELSIDQLNKFLHDCIDDLVDKSNPVTHNATKDFDWSDKVYAETCEYVKHILNNLVCNPQYSIEQNLGKEIIDCIHNCYTVRKTELQTDTVRKALQKMDVGLVTDYDWKFKWIIGSSALSSIKQPIIQFQLCNAITTEDGNELNDINFEMDSVELDNFISTLEKIVSD